MFLDDVNTTLDVILKMTKNGEAAYIRGHAIFLSSEGRWIVVNQMTGTGVPYSLIGLRWWLRVQLRQATTASVVQEEKQNEGDSQPSGRAWLEPGGSGSGPH